MLSKPHAVLLLCLLCHTSIWSANANEPPITALAFSPDGSVLVVGSQAGISVRNWPTLQPKHELATDLAGIHSIQFAPGGNRFAVAGGVPSEQGIVEVFSWPQLELEARLHEHDDTIHSLAWRDDETFATGSLDQEIALWDRKKPQPLFRFQGHSKGITTLEFLADKNLLLSGSIDQTIRLWDPKTAKIQRTLNNHTQPIHASRQRPLAEGLPMVATVSDDKTVRIWQPTIGRLVRFCRLDVVPLAVTWLSDGTQIIVACNDGSVQSIDPDTATVTRVQSVLTSWAYAIETHPSENSVVVGGRGGELKRIELTD